MSESGRTVPVDEAIDELVRQYAYELRHTHPSDILVHYREVLDPSAKALVELDGSTYTVMEVGAA